VNRFSRIMIVLVVLLSGVVCNGAPAQAGPDIVCDSQDCINLNTFSTQLANALNGQLAPNGDPGNVAGYIFYIGSRPPVFNGPARTSVDPPSTRMGPNIPGQIASLSKTLTAIGVLQALAKHNPPLTIDAKMSNYLPGDWSKTSDVDQITFRQLLTHRAGITDDMCNGGRGLYQDLKAMIANFVPSNGIFYANCNFALFRILLPIMEGYNIPPPLTVCPPVRFFPCQVFDLRAGPFAADYIDYMQRNVFQPVGIRDAECAAAEAPPLPPAIKSYPVPPGSTPGNDWGDFTLNCGAGGWVITPQDLETVVTDLASGNILLTPDQKTGPFGMFTNDLGWDTAIRPDCAGFIPPSAPSQYLCKNGGYGAFNPGSPTLSTYLGIFKCTVPVVVYVNSDMSFPSVAVGGFLKFDDIIDVVGAAYHNSIIAGETPPPDAPNCPG
jgi:hypothetical protein